MQSASSSSSNMTQPDQAPPPPSSTGMVGCCGSSGTASRSVGQVTLPTCIIELVLAYAPLANPYSPNSALHLLGVLPRNSAPLAFRTLVVVGCRDPSPNNPVTFRQLVTSATPDHLAESVADAFLPALLLDNTLRTSFIFALSRAGKPTTLARLHANGVSMANFWEAPAESAAAGSLDTLKWWQSVLDMPDEMYDEEDNTLDEEATVREDTASLRDNAYWFVRNAAIRHGHVHVLEYLRTSLQSFAWPVAGWEYASRDGHLELLQWAKARGYAPSAGFRLRAMDFASTQGHVRVLKWWTKNFAVDRLHYSVRAMDDASANGHLHVLDWWSRSGLPLKFTPAAKVLAMKAGHMDVVRFWLECGDYQFLLRLSGYASAQAYEQELAKAPPRLHRPDPGMLAAFGQVQWIVSAWGLYLQDGEDLAEVCIMAARFGHTAVLEQYCAQLKNAEPLFFYHGYHPLVVAAEHGHLGCVQWVVSCLSTIWSNIWRSATPTFQDAATKAMANGHVHVLEWMLANDRVRGELDIDELFTQAFSSGWLELLDLFYAEGYFGELLAAHYHKMHDNPLLGLRHAAIQGRVSVFAWCAKRKLHWTNRRLEWSPFQCPLAEALKHSKVDLLNWWELNPRWVDWKRCDEDLVACLVVQMNRKSLNWLCARAQEICLPLAAFDRAKAFLSGGRNQRRLIKVEPGT